MDTFKEIRTTPELVQDIIHESVGMSHEQFGIMIIEDLKELYKEFVASNG